MHPALNTYLARALIDERQSRADAYRRSRVESSTVRPDPYGSVTVRFDGPDDAEAVVRLAELDGRKVPPRPLLLAEVGRDLLAARSLKSGAAIADPFRPTAHLVELLELRSTHLRDGAGGGTRPSHRRWTWLRALGASGRC